MRRLRQARRSRWTRRRRRLRSQVRLPATTSSTRPRRRQASPSAARLPPAARGCNGQTATITIVDSANTVKDTYTTTVTAGAWSVNVTAAQAQGLADGSYSIKANLSDAAGNAATTASAGDHGGRDCAIDCDHCPGCRRQHHQQDRGGGGCSPSAARLWPAAGVQRSTARPRRSRSSTAPTRSRTPTRPR